MKDKIELRTFVVIDNLQPQVAAATGTVTKADTCLAQMAQLYIEISPGSQIYTLLHTALKNTNVKPGFIEVERDYGELELHSFSISDVKEAGEAILKSCNLNVNERIKPKIVSEQIIPNVDPYEAQLINRGRHGSLLQAGESLFIMEVEPAAYIALAVNEAEKNADIKLITFDPVGKFGRMFLSGSLEEVQSARNAAISILQNIDGIV